MYVYIALLVYVGMKRCLQSSIKFIFLTSVNIVQYS